MIKYDYLIIGGGIAGVTGAETIREHDINGSIGIISDEKEILYSRVLLPAYVKGRITREQLFLRRAEDFTKKSIDLFPMHSVESVDSNRRTVMLREGFGIEYKKLLIASGGRVKPWGTEEDRSVIYRLQTIEDADRLFSSLSRIRAPIVIGSSFISLEFLEIFIVSDIAPALFSRDAYFFQKFLDERGGELLQRNFERHGIQTYFGDTIAEISKKDGMSLITAHMQHVSGDSLAVGVGLERNINFLNQSGVECSEKGVRVNEYLETSHEGVFAAGDVAEYYDVILGEHRILGNWTHAFLQGRRAGLNMAGQKELFRAIPAYSISHLGLHITFLGDCINRGDSIVRVDETKVEYERFFMKNGVLQGAILINRFFDKAHLTKLIERKAPVQEYRQGLTSFQFDIKTIPIVG